MPLQCLSTSAAWLHGCIITVSMTNHKTKTVTVPSRTFSDIQESQPTAVGKGSFCQIRGFANQGCACRAPRHLRQLLGLTLADRSRRVVEGQPPASLRASHTLWTGSPVCTTCCVVVCVSCLQLYAPALSDVPRPVYQSLITCQAWRTIETEGRAVLSCQRLNNNNHWMNSEYMDA